MAATVNIKDIIEALEEEQMFDQARAYLDLDTGKVETVSLEMLSLAEESEEDEEPELLDWQRDEWEIANRIVSSDRFVELPDKEDFNEWDVMADFAQSRPNSRLREELLEAIDGKGAFRHFKSTIRRHKIEEQWYTFRTEALKDIAIEWCKENDVPYR